MKKFSLVTTVFNEASRLENSLNDIENQSVKPFEIIIVDAGSGDGTWELLNERKKTSTIPYILLQEKSCNVATGRNIAIKNASCDLIVSTDFGCRYHKNWLKSLITPFENPEIQVVGGAYTVNDDELDTIAARADYILSQAYNIPMDSHFIPSSRSIAYYKTVWEKVGGYPQWLTLAGDDSTFGFLLKCYNIDMHFVKSKFVFWSRHKSMKGFNKENFRYGLGAGESRTSFRNFFISFAETKLRYWFFIAVFIIIFQLLPNVFTVPIAVLGTFGFLPWLAAARNWLKIRSSKFNFRSFLFALLMLETNRIYYFRGYLKGYFFSSVEVKNKARELNKRLKLIIQ